MRTSGRGTGGHSKRRQNLSPPPHRAGIKMVLYNHRKCAFISYYAIVQNICLDSGRWQPFWDLSILEVEILNFDVIQLKINVSGAFYDAIER